MYVNNPNFPYLRLCTNFFILYRTRRPTRGRGEQSAEANEAAVDTVLSGRARNLQDSLPHDRSGGFVVYVFLPLGSKDSCEFNFI